MNLTYYCHHSNYCLTLKKLLSTSNEIRFYIYINAPYPISDKPLLLKDNYFIMSKKIIIPTLDKVINDAEQIEKTIRLTNNSNSSIFTLKEQCIINSWMNETPNHIISKTGISNSTVYSQKDILSPKSMLKTVLSYFYL